MNFSSHGISGHVIQFKVLQNFSQSLASCGYFSKMQDCGRSHLEFWSDGSFGQWYNSECYFV